MKHGMRVSALLESLPAVLKADELKAVARAVVAAKRLGKPVLIMFGGHVIKTGCAPVLAGLAADGFITHLASNGAAAIHDTELARFGHTSEDVAAQLEDGSFGMASDTALLVNNAANGLPDGQEGFGEAVGALLREENAPHVHRALIARAHRLKHSLHPSRGRGHRHRSPAPDGQRCRHWRGLAEGFPHFCIQRIATGRRRCGDQPRQRGDHAGGFFKGAGRGTQPGSPGQGFHHGQF
jgi:hypothetical protein